MSTSTSLIAIVLLAIALHGVTANALNEPVASHITWSNPTNGVRTGIQCELWESHTNPRCVLFIQNITTNIIHLNMPSFTERFTAELRNKENHILLKTTNGKRFGKALSKDASFRSHGKSYVENCFEPKQAGHFEIDDLFVISKPGQYTLEIGMRLFEDKGERYFRHVYLPTIKVQLDLKQNTPTP